MKYFVRNWSWTELLLDTGALTLPCPKSTDTLDTVFAGLKTAVSAFGGFRKPRGLDHIPTAGKLEGVNRVRSADHESQSNSCQQSP